MAQTITYGRIIEAAPFSKQRKQEIYNTWDSLPASKRYEIEDEAWELIIRWYRAELDRRRSEAFREMAQGTKVYNDDAYYRMQSDLTDELLKKLTDNPQLEDIWLVEGKVLNS